MTGWLDRLPTMLRDLLFAVSGAIATWGTSDLVPWLQGRSDAWSLLAPLLVVVFTAITRATKAYGNGHNDK